MKFTVEDKQENCVVPLLNTLVKPETDNTLSITVNRKHTHTDQYLQWYSHHNLVAKYSVISTLPHRGKTVCTKPELLNKEIQHLRKPLSKCKYPKWPLDKVERKFTNRSQENSNAEPREEDSNSPSGNTIGRDTTQDKHSKEHIVIPYTQELGESIKKICSKYGIQTHFKGNKTIKQRLVKPKDKDPLYKEEWGHLLVSVWGTHIWWGVHRKRHLEHLEKDIRNTWKKPSPIHGYSS